MKKSISILSAIIGLFSFNLQALPPTLEFNTLSVDPNGIIWVGTNQYLYSKLPGGELIKRYYTTGDGNAYLPIADMAQHTETTPYKMLLASPSGARYFTFNNDQLSGGETLLADKAVTSVTIDANSRWIATPGGFSVHKNGNWMNISYFDINQEYIIKNYSITSTVLNRDTAYMVVREGEDGGIVQRFVKEIDGVTGASPYEKWGPCPLEQILCLAIDGNGEQWFGGEKGLYWHQGSRYKEDEWQWYAADTTGWGLGPSDFQPIIANLLSNRIQSVAVANGYAWAGTQQGVSRVERNTDGSIQVKNYSVADANGIIDIAAGPDNTVYAITKKTLYAISGDAIDPTDHISVEKAVSATNISIFPNPASDYINIEVNLNAPAKAEVSLFSLDGKKVRQFYQGSVEAKETLSFPLNGITPGSYLCTLTIGKDRFTNIVVIK